jgi:predicted nucleic acid-binding protein
MRAVDTNVLVRLVTRDDAKQVAAAEAFVAKGAWVPHLVLAEAMWVLASVCLVLEVARKAGHLPLGTFDRELGKLDGAEKL